MSASRSEHQAVVLEHHRRPRHRGLREPFDAQVQHLNPTCGDRVTLRVALDGEVVRDVSWEALGCALSQASASAMADLVVGRPLAEARATRERFLALVSPVTSAPDGPGEDAEELLGDAAAFSGVARHPARRRCAVLAWDAFEDAAARAAGG